VLVVALAAAVLLPGGTAHAAAISMISQPFNGTAIAGNDFLWFNSVIQLTGPVPTQPFDVFITNSTITSTHFAINVPNSEIIFSPTAKQATTTFGASGWVTTIPMSVDTKDRRSHGRWR